MKQSGRLLPSYFYPRENGYHSDSEVNILESRKRMLKEVMDDLSMLKWRFAGNIKQIETSRELMFAEAIYHQLLHVESLLELLRHELTSWSIHCHDKKLCNLNNQSLKQWDIIFRKLKNRLQDIRKNKESMMVTS
jgi:hypothetical protein